MARLGGREPEAFHSIARRAVGARPDLRRSAPRTLAALAGFAKMLLTRPPNLDRIAADRDFVLAAAPRFSQDDPAWVQSHAPQPIPDKPREVA
ncbi:hypothetical protein AIOL_003064 [Candidatus Rhodobacter oscarellae]|uniref:Uncharacterized protein n=1 Tax=Candidatus Rhodobacter oscarellae TaxID=1675527 RepID=A0A0J9GX40_9RHOB|nr:hypothetical protein AIOL_003064 [Candidatus Rhodobacter lobularis]